MPRADVRVPAKRRGPKPTPEADSKHDIYKRYPAVFIDTVRGTNTVGGVDRGRGQEDPGKAIHKVRMRFCEGTGRLASENGV